MEREHLKPMNAGRGRKRGRASKRPSLSCDFAYFTYDKAVDTPTLKAEARPVTKKQRKVA